MKKLEIDKTADVPAYRQIIEKITAGVQSGELQAGEKLLPERELARQLGTARGTVKKAYEQLAANHIVQIIHGRGTFVSAEQDVASPSRKDQAVRLINQAVRGLEKLNFSFPEINTMFQLLLTERRRQLENFAIAAIDCNPEALSIFEIQLKHISSVGIHKYLLDDISGLPEVRRTLMQYEIILTTSTHYNELIGLVPEARSRIIQAAVSPSQQTIIDLATIPPDARVGIITASENFLKIIRSKLRDFQINLKTAVNLFENRSDRLPEFLSGCRVLIVPPKCALENQRECIAAFRAFREKGGRIIRFEYQLERSTLIRIEEKIAELMEKRKNPGL
ncbi:MAG: winged helix-turn-helix domain-containing protein [Victivallaceae bacterium]|nr:winged helix-turn-helix domain-containing protein [Victivallaceae bacterium]